MRQDNQSSALTQTTYLTCKVSVFANIRETIPQAETTLADVLAQIRDEKFAHLVQAIRAEQDKAKRDILKKTLPAFTPSGTFSERKKSSLKEHSGVIVIDFDNVANLQSARASLIKDPYTFALFISPSGTGLKVLVKIDKSQHLKMFKSLTLYYKKTYKLDADSSGKDVSRLCFFSSDKDLFVNENSKQFELRDELNTELILRNALIPYRRASVGERHATNTRQSFLLGGLVAGGVLDEREVLDAIENEIRHLFEPERYADEMRTAKECFEAGKREPIFASDVVSNKKPNVSTSQNNLSVTTTADSNDDYKFFIEGNCTFFEKGNKVVKVANFNARIVEKIVIDDGQTQRKMLVIEGENYEGRKLEQLTIPSASFDEMKWVSEWLPHVSIAPRMKDYVRFAINSTHTDIVRTRYVHTGYRVIDGKLCYLSHNSVVGIDSSNAQAFSAELDDNLSQYSLPQEASPELAKQGAEAMKTILELAPRHISFPLFASLFCAPLTPYLDVDFAVWLVGESGSMKTTLATLLLNAFGDFSTKHLLSWNSTANSLEANLFALKDSLCVIDDFAPQPDSYSSARLEQVVSRVVRDIGNSSGRGRLKTDLSQQQTLRPRGFVVCTGEQLPDVSSILARLFIVSLKKVDVNLDKLNAVQEARHTLKHAMRTFIEFVISNDETLKMTIPRLIETLRAEFATTDAHARNVSAAAKMSVAFEMGVKFLASLDVIDEDDVEKLCKECEQVMRAQISAQTKAVAAESPIQIFFDTISDLLDASKILLESRDGTRNFIGLGERVGFFDSENIYLIPSSFGVVCKALRDSDRRFPLKQEAFWRMLVDKGYVIANNDRYTKLIKVGGTVYRVVEIDVSKVPFAHKISNDTVLRNHTITHGELPSRHDEDMPF